MGQSFFCVIKISLDFDNFSTEYSETVRQSTPSENLRGQITELYVLISRKNCRTQSPKALLWECGEGVVRVPVQQAGPQCIAIFESHKNAARFHWETSDGLFPAFGNSIKRPFQAQS